MLQRALVKESVAERQQQLFHAAGIRHYKQLAMRSSWDLAHAVDVSVQEMELMRHGKAFEMFIESANHPMFLRTGLPAMDQALNGGINYGGITEFTGIAGIGKSQLAMTLSVLCAIEYPAATVLYFDTEHNFSAKRLKELEESMHAMNVKLLVIDSVASLFMKVVLERYPQHRIMAIVKSPVAGYVVQPYAIDESGVQASVDEATLSTVETDNFDVHDDLLYDLASLPMVEPSCTFRSTQKSSAREENDGENSDESSFDLFDLVSDSNDEDDEYDKSIGDLTEDR
uniref:RecA family profile 1 domain-containing protein n=1 Tax=Globisporangium ultimum (strain ATCC 200006 / CBS 805.95 / DAOM BR144) TaxID=431595 RepID=K3X9Y4_GLOUD